MLPPTRRAWLVPRGQQFARTGSDERGYIRLPDEQSFYVTARQEVDQIGRGTALDEPGVRHDVESVDLTN